MGFNEREMLVLELVLGSIDEDSIKEINEMSTYETGEDYKITLDEVLKIWGKVQTQNILM